MSSAAASRSQRGLAPIAAARAGAKAATGSDDDSRQLLLAGLALLTLALAGGLLTANLARADRLGLGG
jgi:hypothetical protein